MGLAITFHAQDILILLLRERRVFRVDIFHDIGNLFGIQTPIMLEPHNTAVYPAVITVRADLGSYFFEQQTLILFIIAIAKISGKLMCKQFLLAIFPSLEYMGVGFGLKCKIRVVGVDYA